MFKYRENYIDLHYLHKLSYFNANLHCVQAAFQLFKSSIVMTIHLRMQLTFIVQKKKSLQPTNTLIFRNQLTIIVKITYFWWANGNKLYSPPTFLYW